MRRRRSPRFFPVSHDELRPIRPAINFRFDEWLKPKLFCEVTFAEWTDDKQIPDGLPRLTYLSKAGERRQCVTRSLLT
jgi:hypothetical protein